MSARARRRRLAAAAVGLLLAGGVSCDRAGEADRDSGQGAERLYVTNTGDDSLSVLDPAARAVIASIPLGNRPHGLAPAPDGRRLYVTTEGGRGEVLAIDTATQAIAWRLDVGANLHQPALARDGRHLFVPELVGGKLYVVDVLERRVAAEIPLLDRDGTTPLMGLHNAYTGASGRWIYETAIFSRALVRIDAAGWRVDRLYPLAGQPRPAALRADESKIYLQFSQLHGFVELDLESGEETARVEWPEPPGSRPGFTKCHGIAIAPGEAELWANSSLENAVHVYSLPELVEIARIEVGRRPHGIATSADGSTVYVVNEQPAARHGTVSVVDRVAKRVVATLDVGARPKRIHGVRLRAAPQP